MRLPLGMLLRWLYSGPAAGLSPRIGSVILLTLLRFNLMPSVSNRNSLLVLSGLFISGQKSLITLPLLSY